MFSHRSDLGVLVAPAGDRGGFSSYDCGGAISELFLARWQRIRSMAWLPNACPQTVHQKSIRRVQLSVVGTKPAFVRNSSTSHIPWLIDPNFGAALPLLGLNGFVGTSVFSGGSHNAFRRIISLGLHKKPF